MKTTTVLVAGTTGFLGNEIIKQLGTVKESLTGLILFAVSSDRIDMKNILEWFIIAFGRLLMARLELSHFTNNVLWAPHLLEEGGK